MIAFIALAYFPTRPLDDISCCSPFQMIKLQTLITHLTKYWIPIELECAVQLKSLCEVQLSARCYEIATDSVSSAERGFFRYEIVWMSNIGLQQVFDLKTPTRCRSDESLGECKKKTTSNSNPKRLRAQDDRLLKCHWQRARYDFIHTCSLWAFIKALNLQQSNSILLSLSAQCRLSANGN